MSQRHRSRTQRGVASLIVVMVLFFIITLVAAYTNRNLIFEQRTSANQYRSTQAYEAAQAGIEWAVAMLNSGRINESCAPSTSSGDDSFRDRNLTIPESGDITPKDRLSACVFNGAGWTCSCPKTGSPSLTAPTTPGLYPAYQVRFRAPVDAAARTGVVRVEAVACPKWDANCLAFDSSNPGDEGRTTLSALVALYGGLKTPPASALTVKGTINTSAGTLTAYNQDLASGGLAVVTGQAITTSKSAPEFVVSGPPGTPPGAAYKDADPSLALPAVAKTGGGTWSTDDRMFISAFGVLPDTYRDSPATLQMNGCLPCSSEGSGGLRALIASNPGRPIWVNGDLVLGGTGDIGAAALPAVVVVSGGNLSFSAPVIFHGAVYVRNNTWTMSGTGTIEGAAIAGGAMTNTGNGTYSYQPTVLNRLRLQNGSFVVVPGSWRDIVE
jgi:hypothetical protein